jgi:hypothetical protein
LSTAREGVLNVHNNGGRLPCERKKAEELSIDNKIHSWNPSEMGEVELEVKVG